MGLGDRKQVEPVVECLSSAPNMYSGHTHHPVWKLPLHPATGSLRDYMPMVTLPSHPPAPPWRLRVIPLGHRFKLTTCTNPQDRCLRTTQPLPALPCPPAQEPWGSFVRSCCRWCPVRLAELPTALTAPAGALGEAPKPLTHALAS